MILWKQQAEKYTLASFQSVSDGEGGAEVTLSYSAPFDCIIENKRSAETLADSERLGGSAVLTSDVELSFGDVIKRSRDGKLFKVVSEVRKSHPAMSFSYWRGYVEEMISDGI